MNIEDLVYTFNTERNHGIRNGVYMLTQRELAYHSNKIAGNDLSKDNVVCLLDTGSIYCSEGQTIKSRDIGEVLGHTIIFDYMLDTLDGKLSQNTIKGLHKHFKKCVFEDVAEGNSVGEYRDSGDVADIEVSIPSDIPDRLEELIAWYRKQEVDLIALAIFYSEYMKISPFKSGSGRVGRMILFRECIRHDMTPFIIQNAKKYSYVQALQKAQAGGEFSELVQLFSNAQADYEALCERALMSKPSSAASVLI